MTPVVVGALAFVASYVALNVRRVRRAEDRLRRMREAQR